MIPVPGLESVRLKWVIIKSAHYILHGFFLYTRSDRYFPEYVDDTGLADLEMWSGKELALFIITPPSRQWIDYTKRTNHMWWQLYGEQVEHLTSQVGDAIWEQEPILQIDDGRKTFQEVFAPRLDQFDHNAEIGRILDRFGLRETDHPCIILFKDMRDRQVWHVDCKEMLGQRPIKLAVALKQWFHSGDIGRIMEEARNA